MRASEFVKDFEGIDLSLEIQKDDEYVDDDDTENQVVVVRASSNGRELGHVLFTMDYDSQGLVLNPQDLEVDERYRGQGIASTMYDFVKSRGYRIRRSGQQTDAGAGFWDKHRPGKNIWEDQGQPEVYLDMDGVLADFIAGYNRVAGTNYGPGEQLPHPSQDPTLKKITGTDFFARLPKFSSADDLVRMVVAKFGHYNICSSPLRGDHENSAANKTQWLRKHLRPQPQQIIITSRKEKHAVQADGTANILVDDKPENIQRWQDAGGVGILYNAATDDLSTVSQVLRDIDLKKHKTQVQESVDINKELLNTARKHGGSLDDYFVRVTDQDKVGFSARQHIGRSPDLDDPEFDLEYIGRGKGRPAVWFYPLRYYLKYHENLYAADRPYVWLARLKPGAWLQDVTAKTKTIEPAPPGKQRVGIMRLSSVPAAIFFQPGYEIVDRWYDYGQMHKRRTS